MRLQRLVGFAPRDIYQVVADIEAYPRWIPALSQVSRVPPNKYTLHISQPPFSLAFTSDVTFTDHSRISATCRSGPFSDLQCHWSFEPVGRWNLAYVTLLLDYTVSNPIYSAALPAILPRLVPFLVEAFRKQCVRIYGPETTPAGILATQRGSLSFQDKQNLMKLQQQFEKERSS